MKNKMLRVAGSWAIGLAASTCWGQSTTPADVPTELRLGAPLSIKMKVVQTKLALSSAEARLRSQGIPPQDSTNPTIQRVGIPQNYEVVFETDGTKTFYSEGLNVDPKQEALSDVPTKFYVIEDGSKTFMIVADGRSVTVDDNATDHDMHFLPLPAVGLPSTPIVKDSGGVDLNRKGVKIPDGYKLINVPYAMESVNSSYRYRAGLLKLVSEGGKAKVVEILGGQPHRASQTWAFENHFKVGDSWVSKNYEWHQYELDSNHEATKELMRRIFQVLEVDQRKVADATFDPRRYIKTGAVVTFETDGSANGGRSLAVTKYDPSLSWDDMRKRAEPYGTGQTMLGPRKSESGAPVGFIGLVIAVSLGAMALLWRKTATSRDTETK